MSDHLDDELVAAFRRQRDHSIAAAAIDRRDWTRQQWADDAERLMHDFDGAVTSLVNGHAMGLIAERHRLSDLTDRLATALREQEHQPHPDAPFCIQCDDDWPCNTATLLAEYDAQTP